MLLQLFGTPGPERKILFWSLCLSFCLFDFLSSCLLVFLSSCLFWYFDQMSLCPNSKVAVNDWQRVGIEQLKKFWKKETLNVFRKNEKLDQNTKVAATSLKHRKNSARIAHFAPSSYSSSFSYHIHFCEVGGADPRVLFWVYSKNAPVKEYKKRKLPKNTNWNFFWPFLSVDYLIIICDYLMIIFLLIIWNKQRWLTIRKSIVDYLMIRW